MEKPNTPRCCEQGCDRLRHYKSGRCAPCERAALGVERPRCCNKGCDRKRDHKSGRCEPCERAALGLEKKRLLCTKEGCPNGIVSGGLCISHGGGYRCATGVHLEDPPYAAYKLSASAISYGSDGRTYTRPEWAGVRCCLDCLKNLDPTNVAVKVFIRKEHLLISEIVSEFLRRGLGDLVSTKSGIATNDCSLGPSLRRQDVDFDLSDRMILDIENDEDQHRDRSTSCEHRKLVGHLADRGAPALTKEEGNLWDPPHPDDLRLAELEGTPEDTSELCRLRIARKKATERVLRDYHAQRRVSPAFNGCFGNLTVNINELDCSVQRGDLVCEFVLLK